MTVQIVPMSLGEIFEQTFKVIGRTFARTLPLIALFMIPAGILISLASDNLFSTVADLAHDQAARDVASISLPSDLMFFGIAVVLFAVSGIIADMGVTLLSCGEVASEPLAWGDALQRSFSIRFARQLGQLALEMVSLAGILVAPIILAVILAGDHKGLALLLGVLLLPVGVGLVIYLKVCWSFTTASIMWEDAGTLQSFQRSGSLVQGSWWRVFGILLLLTILVEIVVGVVQASLNLVTMGTYSAEYFKSLHPFSRELVNPDAAFQMLRPLGLGLAISVSVGTMLTLFLQPVYRSVLYFDLRARKDEFMPPGKEQDPDGGSWEIPPPPPMG